MQTNSFSEQIYKQNQINDLSTAKNFLLTSAIMAVIFSVPLIGLLLGLLLQIPMIASLIIAIMTISFTKKAKHSMIGSIILIIANILSLLTFIILMYISSLPNYSATRESAFTLYMIIGLFTWALYIIATIVLFIEFNSANKTLIQLKFQNASAFQTPHLTTLQPPHLQSPEQILPTTATIESEPQQANPFGNQSESTQPLNPFVTQEVIQPTPISDVSQQTEETTNPFSAELKED